VNDDDKEHAERVLEVCKDMTSNWRIHATNAYLKAHKVKVYAFKQYSTTFLTTDQYASVSDSLLIL
jgi:hypothetical protein